MTVVRSGLLLFRDVGDETLGGEQERGDGRRVLQGRAGHFGWVHHAGLDQVGIFFGGYVEASITLLTLYVIYNDSTFKTSVCGETT